MVETPGCTLDPVVREYMEPHFANDFSCVRFNTDSSAAESARAADASAYTVGRNIVLAQPLKAKERAFIVYGVTGSIRVHRRATS